MKAKSHVSTRTLLATLLLGLVPLSASAAGLCYDPGTHSMVPCGGSAVDDSVAAAVEDSVRNTTQQAVDSAVKAAADAAEETVKNALSEETVAPTAPVVPVAPPAPTPPTPPAPPAPPPAPPVQPTVKSLDDFFANIDYFLNLPANSELIRKLCGCEPTTWEMHKAALKADAALWNSGMTPEKVAYTEDRMKSIKSDNRGQGYWLAWSLPGPSPALDMMMRTLGVHLSPMGGRSLGGTFSPPGGGSLGGAGSLGLSDYQERMKKQFEAAGGKYPW